MPAQPDLAGGAPANIDFTMNEPSQFPLQAPIGKTVGRRRLPANTLSVLASSKAQARAWRKAFPTPFVPRGVYRFKTHEEADAWLWKMIAQVPKS